MRNQKVIISDKSIFLEDNPRNVVMDKASKNLMEYYSYIVCQNKGDVLDVGFGMGFSANKMSELADSYTCIETNPQIYKNASAWAKTKTNVNIIFGDWIDIIPQLGLKYDGIFMDTHNDPNYEIFEQTCKQIAKEGCILSIYNYFTQRDPSTTNEHIYKLDNRNFSVNVKDHHKVNWTVFDGEKFTKTSNKVSFPKPSKLL